MGSHLSVGRGTAILVVGTALLFLFGFLSRVLIARAYPIEDWGIFSIALALSGFLSIASLLGLDQAIARALAFEGRADARAAIVRYGLSIALASSFLASLLVFVAAEPLARLFQMPYSAWVIQIFSVTVGFGVLSLVLAAVFQGYENAFPNAVFNQILNPGLFVGFILAALALHLGFEWIVIGYALAEGIALGGLAAYTLHRAPWTHPGRTAPPVARPLWRLAGALWGVGTLAYVTAFVDTLILGLFRPPADVGSYSAMMTLGRVLLVSNGTLTYIYLPVAARLARSGDFPTIRSTYLVGTRWVLLLVTPGCLLLLLLPKLVLATVFTSQYTSGSLALQVLVVPAFLAVLVGPANACLAGIGRFRALLGTTVLAASMNVALSFALIPSLGILGAAIAWGLARAAYPTAGWVVLYRSHRINPFAAPLVRPTLFTIAALVPLYLYVGAIDPSPWVLVPLYVAGLGVTLVGLLVTRSIMAGDLVMAQLAERLLRRPIPFLRRFIVTFAAGRPVVPEIPAEGG